MIEEEIVSFLQSLIARVEKIESKIEEVRLKMENSSKLTGRLNLKPEVSMGERRRWLKKDWNFLKRF